MPAPGSARTTRPAKGGPRTGWPVPVPPSPSSATMLGARLHRPRVRGLAGAPVIETADGSAAQILRGRGTRPLFHGTWSGDRASGRRRNMDGGLRAGGQELARTDLWPQATPQTGATGIEGATAEGGLERSGLSLNRRVILKHGFNRHSLKRS